MRDGLIHIMRFDPLSMDSYDVVKALKALRESCGTFEDRHIKIKLKSKCGSVRHLSLIVFPFHASFALVAI